MNILTNIRYRHENKQKNFQSKLLQLITKGPWYVTNKFSNTDFHLHWPKYKSLTND